MQEYKQQNNSIHIYNIFIYGGIYIIKLIVLVLIASFISQESTDTFSNLFSSATFFATVSIDTIFVILKSQSYFLFRTNWMVKLFFVLSCSLTVISTLPFCPLINTVITGELVCRIINGVIIIFAITSPFIEFLYSLPAED